MSHVFAEDGLEETFQLVFKLDILKQLAQRKCAKIIAVATSA
jgi:hypothetical protein